jgi:hypothetical protein
MFHRVVLVDTLKRELCLVAPLLMLGGTLLNFLPTLDYLLKGEYDSMSALNITITVILIVAMILALRDFKFIGGLLSLMFVAIVPAINGGGFDNIPAVMILLFLGGITSIAEALSKALRPTRSARL